MKQLIYLVLWVFEEVGWWRGKAQLLKKTCQCRQYLSWFLRNEEQFVRHTSGKRFSMRAIAWARPGKEAGGNEFEDCWLQLEWAVPKRCVMKSFRGQVRRELRTELEQEEKEEPGKKAEEWPRVLLFSDIDRNERWSKIWDGEAGYDVEYKSRMLRVVMGGKTGEYWQWEPCVPYAVCVLAAKKKATVEFSECPDSWVPFPWSQIQKANIGIRYHPREIWMDRQILLKARGVQQVNS